jgi:hypothetical protein
MVSTGAGDHITQHRKQNGQKHWDFLVKFLKLPSSSIPTTLFSRCINGYKLESKQSLQIIQRTAAMVSRFVQNKFHFLDCHCHWAEVASTQTPVRTAIWWPDSPNIVCGSPGPGAEEPCDAEPARAQVDKLRFMNLLPFFRWLQVPSSCGWEYMVKRWAATNSRSSDKPNQSWFETMYQQGLFFFLVDNFML